MNVNDKKMHPKKLAQIVPQTGRKSTPQAAAKHWLGLLAVLLILGFLGNVLLQRFNTDINDTFADYQNRIARLLSAERIPNQVPRFAEQPRINQVMLPIPEGSIGLINSQRLNRCRAGQLIANRNSSLGRVQPTHARVRYEIDMISALSECLADEAIQETSLVPLLEQALHEKITYLPLWISRFWSSEAVIRDTLRPGRNARSIHNEYDSTASIAALNYFSHLFAELLANPFAAQIDSEQWQQHIQVLGTQDTIPSLLRSQQASVGWLTTLNEQLENAGEQLQCQRRVPVNAEYLQNVLHSIWIAQLQPALAQWEAEQRALNDALSRIETQVKSDAWRQYLSELHGYNSLANEVQQLTRAHAMSWQKFLNNCGFALPH